jgi:Tfp pilus assembly protein PilO
MPRNFDVTQRWKSITWRSPVVLARAGVGVLLVANIVAAGFAFHWWNDSPASIETKLADTRRQLVIERSLVTRSKSMASKVDTARSQAGSFIDRYMTPRRNTYSTILGDLDQMASVAGIKTRERAIARDPVEGSTSLSMLTLTASFEGTYPNLLKFMNSLDKSPRFLIVERLQAAPLANSQSLQVTVKLNAFVRDDPEAQS